MAVSPARYRATPIIAFALVVAAVTGCTADRHKRPLPAGVAGAVEVVVAVAAAPAAEASGSPPRVAMQKDVPVEIAAVGNVEAYNTISVRSQVAA